MSKISKIDLIGYVRKDDKHLKITLSVKAFDKAQRILSQDGGEYVTLVAKLDKVQAIIEKTREVAAINQIVED